MWAFAKLANMCELARRLLASLAIVKCKADRFLVGGGLHLQLRLTCTFATVTDSAVAQGELLPAVALGLLA